MRPDILKGNIEIKMNLEVKIVFILQVLLLSGSNSACKSSNETKCEKNYQVYITTSETNKTVNFISVSTLAQIRIYCTIPIVEFENLKKKRYNCGNLRQIKRFRDNHSLTITIKYQLMKKQIQ